VENGRWKIIERESTDSSAAAAEGDIVEEMTVRHGGEQRRTDHKRREECYSSHCAGINMAEKYIWRHSYQKKLCNFIFIFKVD
jgi:hypothetical protein